MIPAWNNLYSTLPYQQQVMPTVQYPPAYQPQQQSNIIKVNGPSSAMQYPTAPNTQSPPLFDTAGDKFYVVTADGAGSKTLETFDFAPHIEEQQSGTQADFVTREEFQGLVSKVEQMIGANNGIHEPVQQQQAGQQVIPASGNGPQPSGQRSQGNVANNGQQWRNM